MLLNILLGLTTLAFFGGFVYNMFRMMTNDSRPDVLHSSITWGMISLFLFSITIASVVYKFIF